MKLRNATPGTQVTEKASDRHGVIMPLGTAVVGTGPENMVRVRFEDSGMDLLVHPRNLRRRRGGGSAFPDTISVRRGGIRYPPPTMAVAKAINRGDIITLHPTPGGDDRGLHFHIRPATDAIPTAPAAAEVRIGPRVDEFNDGDIVKLDNGSLWFLSEQGGTLLHGEWLPGSMNDLLREHSPELMWTLLSSQREAAAAYWDAVAAYTTERGQGPLSTTLGWVIRHGEISKALAAYESCTRPRPHQSRL